MCGVVCEKSGYMYVRNVYVCAYLLEMCRCMYIQNGGARGVMVIVVGNGHGGTSSNPGRG